MIKQFKITIFLCLLMQASTSFAGIEKIIGTLAPKGSMSNVTKTAIVHEQEAGHIMGGSVSISAPPLQDLHLANATPPTCRTGDDPCKASMDFAMGGISFAKGPGLSKTLVVLKNNIQAYGTILAVKTLCPQCEDIMTWLQEAAQTVNSMALKSCAVMTQVAKGMDTVASAASDSIKQSFLLKKGEKDDMASLQSNSKKPDKRLDNESTGDHPELKSLLGDNFNLVWKALDERAADGADSELKEFLMSLSGTVIAKKSNGTSSFSHKRSLINATNLAQFIGIDVAGNDFTIYSCDEYKKCLNPKKQKAAIDKSKTFKAKVEVLLKSIVKKIAVDGGSELTAEEQTLVSLSSSPLIIKIEDDFIEYGGNVEAVVIAQDQDIDVLCYAVVTKYLAQMLDEVREAVSELERNQRGDIGAFKAFEQQASQTMRMLAGAKDGAYRRHAAIAGAQDRILNRNQYLKNTILKRITK
jgi:hypothetical protein